MLWFHRYSFELQFFEDFAVDPIDEIKCLSKY